MELLNIPDWMEQFIPQITENQLKTKQELIEHLGDNKNGIFGVMRSGIISNLNTQISLLQRLHENNLLNIL
jgi:hypothetical protein